MKAKQKTSADDNTPKKRRLSLRGIGVQVIIAMTLGVLVGFVAPQFATSLKVLGDIFISLIKVGIAPLIFLTIVTGITSARDLKKTGKIALYALIYFELVSTLALIIGLVSGNLFKIGHGAASLAKVASPPPAAGNTESGFGAFVKALVPESFVGTLTSSHMLPVVVLAVIFGIGLLTLDKETLAKVNAGLEVISKTFYALINVIIRVAPLGAFGAVAYAVASNGTRMLVALVGLVVQYWVTVAVFVLVVLGAICAMVGINIFRLMRYLKVEMALVFGTSSSEPAIPGLLDKLPKLGLPRQLVGLVIPTGFAFNLDGNSMYMAVCTLFLANAFGIPMGLPEQLGLLAIMLVTSKGAATVNGGAFVAFAATVTATGYLPSAGLAILFGVFQFMSRATAMCNTLGNAVATVVIARFNKVLDIDEARRVLLQGRTGAPAVQENGRTCQRRANSDSLSTSES